ncbi:peptidylprolyl isomerase [Nanoarchaeota archaeon]
MTEKKKHKTSKHTHHAKHAKHTKHTKKHKHPKHKKERPNWILGAVIFVVLVAVVYGIIVLLGKAGTAEPKVAAYVNDEPITTAYLNEQYDRIPAEYKAFVTKLVLLNQTINEVLLLQQAEKAGVVVTEEEVQAEINKAVEAAGLEPGMLEAKLAEQNLTEEFLRDLYRKQLTINGLLEKKVFSKLQVSEREITEYYDTKVRAAHVLVETKEEAENVILDLMRTPTDELTETFFELAEEKSKDPSAATNKGDLGEFNKGMMVPPFEQAVFELEEGEYTKEPVQTQFGYHVIMRLAKDKTLEEQHSEIEDFILLQKKSQAVPLYVEQIKAKAHIQILLEPEPAPEAPVAPVMPITTAPAPTPEE